MATMRWGWLAWLVKERPIRVIENGRLDPQAMKRANLSEDDLKEALRLEQIGDPSEVQLAMLEGSGKLSVVRKGNK